MPMYCYECPMCGYTIEDMKNVAYRNDGPPCGPCGERTGKVVAMERDISAEGVNSTDMEYAKPILSEAMGVAPNQVNEHRRLHPNIPILDDGRVVVRSHAEHGRIMKRLGFFNKN